MPIVGEMKGDLIKLAKAGLFDVIVHGANCFCTMNSGIAKEIKKEFPEAYDADRYGTLKGDKNKLSYWTWADYPEDREYPDLTVINLYTQYDFGYDGKDRLDYQALRTGFSGLNGYYPRKKIGIPLIGCGLAANCGDWERVKAIINKATPDLDIFVVHYEEIK